MVRYFLISPWLQNLNSYTYFGRYTDWRLWGGGVKTEFEEFESRVAEPPKTGSKWALAQISKHFQLV